MLDLSTGPMILAFYSVGSLVAAVCFASIAAAFTLRPTWDTTTIPNRRGLYSLMIALAGGAFFARLAALFIGPNVMEIMALAAVGGSSAMTAFYTWRARSLALRLQSRR